MEQQMSFGDDPEMIKLQGTWRRTMERLKTTMSEGQYAKYLGPLRPKAREDNVIIIAAPGNFLVTWVKKNFKEPLERALSDELGQPVTIDLVAEPNPKPTAAQKIAPPTLPAAAPKLAEFSEKFTFDSFVVGQSNRLAHAGAYAVAQEPSLRFNPLFIYGGSGLGKTHLLYAVANHIAKNSDGDKRVEYITGQQFAETFINALQHGRVDQFRRNLRLVDVWLLDDVQFIAGKDKTQEELFYAFNHLQQAGKQIVFCSDRAPRDLYSMDDRLRSRFECGLVADIMPPDTETRTAIVKVKARDDGVDLPHEVCEFLAINVPGNVRTLEGALTKVIAQASLDKAPLTVGLAGAVVEATFPPQHTPKPTFEKMLEEVSAYYDVPQREIRGQSRKAEIAYARHMLVYLARSELQLSWKRLGDLCGGRDHTSMIHAYRKIAEQMTKNLDVQSDHRNLHRRIQG